MTTPNEKQTTSESLSCGAACSPLESYSVSERWSKTLYDHRMDEDFHLGMGDIRMTFATQEDVVDAMKRLETERNILKQWKAEAMIVLGEWEKTWEAAGSPGRLGESKAIATREFILENSQDR
jgi:hypothetical protein